MSLNKIAKLKKMIENQDMTLTPSEMLELRKNWINRLKSGKTKKLKGSLRNSKGSMCCLGVLCHQNKDLLNVSKNEDSFAYNGEDGSLPKTMHDILGIKDDCDKYDTKKMKDFLKKFKVKYDDMPTSLVDLNDGTNASHVTIGKFIEEFYNDLFEDVNEATKQFNKKYKFNSNSFKYEER